MRRAALASGVVYSLLLSFATFAQTSKSVETIPVSQIHAGMHGVAYTVFEGTKPEAMQVEVLGVLKNANGPKGDVILVRLGGKKAEYTGVVAGMSGSPVYFDGRLAGALAFRIGEFSKEPIAGVTPIAEMLEISALDRRPESPETDAKASVDAPTRTSTPGISSAPSANYANYLKPIEAPLVFNGFSEVALRQFAPQFAAAGIVPVMGVGSVSDTKQPERLEPGSAVSAILVRGDMDIAATCTVTYMDAAHLLACGHPLMQFGSVNLPMTKAQVVATLASPLNAFKIVNATEPVGAFVQDRHTGIMGEFGKKPDMIPVTLNIRGGPSIKKFHYEVLNNAHLSPLAMMATVFNALHGMNEYGEDVTYRMNGSISVGGYPDVGVEHMFAAADGGQPAAVLAALSLGDRRIRHGAPLLGRKLDLPSAIALLNKQHVNNRVYVSLLEGDPEAMVGDKVMPTLPLSVMNVMDGMRGTQDMVVLGESSVNETSSQALDYVVSGAQVLTITVR